MRESNPLKGQEPEPEQDPELELAGLVLVGLNPPKRRGLVVRPEQAQNPVEQVQEPNPVEQEVVGHPEVREENPPANNLRWSSAETWEPLRP